MTKQWKCKVCGYVHEGPEPPEKCPRCGASRYQFVINAPLPPELQALLARAFAGESQAYVRNQAYARPGLTGGLPRGGQPVPGRGRGREGPRR